jgi:hypothetical protein
MSGTHLPRENIMKTLVMVAGLAVAALPISTFAAQGFFAPQAFIIIQDQTPPAESDVTVSTADHDAMALLTRILGDHRDQLIYIYRNFR